jgi:hypothetical protein
MDAPWTIEQRLDEGYRICYDGVIVGLVDKRSHAERLVLAANACRHVSNDDLAEIDVFDLIHAVSSFLTSLDVRGARRIATGREP